MRIYKARHSTLPPRVDNLHALRAAAMQRGSDRCPLLCCPEDIRLLPYGLDHAVFHPDGSAGNDGELPHRRAMPCFSPDGRRELRDSPDDGLLHEIPSLYGKKGIAARRAAVPSAQTVGACSRAIAQPSPA